MKKTNWTALALFAAAAAGLRVWQCFTGFDGAGLAIRGNVPALLLPLVLAAAAVFAVVSTRRIPVRRDAAGGLSERFRFSDRRTLAFTVAGAFLMVAGAAVSLTQGASTVRLLLALFATASALSILYAALSLRRGAAVQGIALLVPVCGLIVYLIFLYRTGSADPVLARVYLEILAASALALGSLELAAFAFCDGSPRLFACVGQMALILSLAVAAEGKSLASTLLYLGCAFAQAGFLAAMHIGGDTDPENA